MILYFYLVSIVHVIFHTWPISLAPITSKQIHPKRYLLPWKYTFLPTESNLVLWYYNKKGSPIHKTPGDTHMHVALCVWHVLTADDALKPLQQRQKRSTGTLGRPLIISFLCPTVPQLKQQQDGRQHLAEKEGNLLSSKNKLMFAIPHQN